MSPKHADVRRERQAQPWLHQARNLYSLRATDDVISLLWGFLSVTAPRVRPVHPLTCLGWGGGGGGGGGGGLGGMMTTLAHKHPEHTLHKSRFTRYLQYCRDGGPSYMVMADDG